MDSESFISIDFYYVVIYYAKYVCLDIVCLYIYIYVYISLTKHKTRANNPEFQKQIDRIYMPFSVVKATLELQLSVCLLPKPLSLPESWISAIMPIS